ncbi:hypothetical protein QVD17_15064 [Tagetes erecta]|uniref:Uncharacterized protein n=1 Tax=Tagetes erecta TaxID=13708 RepID=A0AAD8NYC7_TARER|nr:hypothetical protein QVD17_15064 [Tagetes erecta]
MCLKLLLVGHIIELVDCYASFDVDGYCMYCVVSWFICWLSRGGGGRSRSRHHSGRPGYIVQDVWSLIKPNRPLVAVWDCLFGPTYNLLTFGKAKRRLKGVWQIESCEGKS